MSLGGAGDLGATGPPRFDDDVDHMISAIFEGQSRLPFFLVFFESPLGRGLQFSGESYFLQC
jgi:hypothetical protein